MFHIVFIHLSVDEHLGYSHVTSTLNSAAMNIGVHVSFDHGHSDWCEVIPRGFDLHFSNN